MYSKLLKKIVVLVTTTSLSIFAISATAFADDTQTYTIGDVNDNGTVNIVDAQIIYDMNNDVWTETTNFDKLLAALNNGWDVFTLRTVADANGDKVNNAADARKVQADIHSGGVTPTPTPTNPSGTCGANLTWIYDLNTNTLTVSGSGDMDGYYQNSGGVPGSKAPWNAYYASMEKVVINEGVTSIGRNAFYTYTALTSVSIPSSVTSIGEYAFYNTGLTGTFNVPSTITKIGFGAFQYCNSVTTFNIYCNLANSERSTFANCKGLTSINIAEGTTSIPDGTFSGDKVLTTVSMPSTVTSIGTGAFYNCPALSQINYNGTVTSRANIAISSNNESLTNANWIYR